MTVSSVRAAIYARISEDATGEAAGVRRQMEDARALAEWRGWTVVEECSDNDISALRGKHRPGYERILDLVRAGNVDHIIVWQTSRLLRNRRERADAIETFGRARVGIISVRGQDLDLSTAYGRGMAGLLGEFDTMESEVKSERVAAAAADRAARGRPNGALGYGWTRNDDRTYSVNPDEAAVVQEIVQRLLGGDSLLSVTTDLNRRAVPAPMAPSWGKTSVKKIALRPSNAGLRVHHRGRDTERIHNGDWPTLVPYRDWERLTTLLTDPSRRSNGATRPGARRHLLTWGIGECGVCGSYLRVSMKGHQTYGTKKRLYVCSESGCVGRDEDRVDEFVSGVVIARLARPDAISWMLGDEAESRKAGEHAALLRARLVEAADRYADGKITADQLERVTFRLRPQIEAAEGEQRRQLLSMDVDAVADLAGPAAATQWESMSVAQRRRLLVVLRVRVRLVPVAKKGPGFDPSSVEIEWVEA